MIPEAVCVRAPGRGVSRVQLSLEELQARLRVLALPPAVWALPTIGALQAAAKPVYRAACQRWHPDHRVLGRLTPAVVDAMAEAWERGATVQTLADEYHLSYSYVWQLATRRRVPARWNNSVHFRRLTKAYQWLLRLPPDAAMPASRLAILWLEWRQLATPLCVLVPGVPARRCPDPGPGFQIARSGHE